LKTAEIALTEGRPSIALGGKRLWRNRHHLDQTDMTAEQWRHRWHAKRMFLAADGETGKVGGNETIRVDAAGRVRVKVPAALSAEFGSHLTLAIPVRFVHRSQEWSERVAERLATRYDITFDPTRGRWYLDASWKQAVAASPELSEVRKGPVLGVDLNADHLACCVLDSAGNPVGEPMSITLETAGMPVSRRDGRVRAAISALLEHADRYYCTAIAVENLDFVDARATGRETMGRGARGKRFRRTVAGISTARFRTRLIGMAMRRGIAVIGVDAAYTSR
jgi:hypothetical protein